MNVGRLSISKVGILPAYDTVVKVDKRSSIIAHGTHLPDVNNVRTIRIRFRPSPRELKAHVEPRG